MDDGEITGDDEGTDLTPEERAAAVRLIATPALTESIARFTSQFEAMSKQVTERHSQLLARQIAPALQMQQMQISQVGRALVQFSQVGRALGVQAEQVQRAMQPLSEAIAARQRQWALSLKVPLMATSQFAEMAGRVVTPEFTEAIERINRLAQVRVMLPNEDGIARLAELIDNGEVDQATLDIAEAGVAEDAGLSEAIDDAAEVLSASRPWISRKRARQLIVFWVWIMWSAAIVAVTVAAPPAVAAVPGAVGLPAGNAAAKRAGEEFDKRYPPDDETA